MHVHIQMVRLYMCIVPFSVLHACKFAYLQALTLVFQKGSAQLEVLPGGQLGPDQLAYIETQSTRVHKGNVYMVALLNGMCLLHLPHCQV